MWPESSETVKPLRTGFTTGCCATACCVAAAEYLFTGRPLQVVSVTLPRGRQIDMAPHSQRLSGELSEASMIKDAGDDPDVTHGAKITITLKKQAKSGIHFMAGKGVGTVTRAGLLLPVGEPAINPVPREMMTAHLEQVAGRYGYKAGFSVTVSVENGEALAKKTMNPKLGILGGLSILGTTGIVRPFSCSAYIASIHQAVDVAKANGLTALAATTGNSSETFVREHFGLQDMAMVEMGDFVGALLKHLRKQPVDSLIICGGFGKISKLAEGAMDLHSKASSICLETLAEDARALGADDVLQNRVRNANTSVQALAACLAAGLPLGDRICEKACTFALSVIRRPMQLRVIAINRQGEPVGESVQVYSA